MPDAISGVAAAYPPPTSTVDRPDQLGKDTFLQLLVAQLRYQDPSNPADSSQMMSQTATFSQVEKLEQMVEQNASLLALQRSSSAGALVGRTVTYTDTTGASVSGVVTSVRLGTGSSDAVAMIGSTAVETGRITEIAQTTTS
ncbi:flagellar hook capping FlgD N-terminal domain-containing protein [Geodermatophilus sp. SYSU D01186]